MVSTIGEPIAASLRSAARIVGKTDLALPLAKKKTAFDFDGDGKAMVGIFRPGVGEWWIYRSRPIYIRRAVWRVSGQDRPGRYTGDGNDRHRVWRPATGEWVILRSEDSTY